MSKINFRHELPAASTKAIKKANKKARRQARDMMRAHFDYDAIRVELGEIVAQGEDVTRPTVDQAYDLYYDEDADVA